MNFTASFRLNPLLTSAVFVGSVLAAKALLERVPTSNPLHPLLLAVPLPFLVLFLLSAVVSFKRFDTLQRALLVEGLTFAVAATVLVAAVAQLLERAGVPVWHNQDVWPYLAFVGYLVGYGSALRRNQ